MCKSRGAWGRLSLTYSSGLALAAPVALSRPPCGPQPPHASSVYSRALEQGLGYRGTAARSGRRGCMEAGLAADAAPAGRSNGGADAVAGDETQVAPVFHEYISCRLCVYVSRPRGTRSVGRGAQGQ